MKRFDRSALLRLVVAAVLLLAVGGVALAQESERDRRSKAVHIAYRLDMELGEIDAAQRHLLVARLLLALETEELSPAAAVDELWLDWETRIEAMEDLVQGDPLPVWHQPTMPDLVDALSESVLPGQVPLDWSDRLWGEGLAATALTALTGTARSVPVESAYYPGLLAWARSHGPEIWFRLLEAIAATPEWSVLITPLVDPWLALPLTAPLADWRNLDDRSSARLAALFAAKRFDPLALIDREIDLLFDEALLIDRHQRPVLVEPPYLRFLYADDDPGTQEMIALARSVHRLEAGAYAEFVGALYGILLGQALRSEPGDRAAELLARLDRLDALLLPFLDRVDARLINVYQQLRRLLREPVGDVEQRQQRIRTLAGLESALGLDVAGLDRYLAQPFRERLTNDLVVCVGLTRNSGPRPPEPITREQFQGCVNSLSDWALSQASSPELAGQPEGPFAPENLARETDLSTWQRVNYWLGYVASSLGEECGRPRFQLVNPIEWAIAGRSLVWFMDRWPQLVDAQALARLTSVRDAGQATLLELARIRRCVAPGQPLLGAIDVYRGNLGRLVDALSLATSEFREENLATGADVDFAGPPDQPTRYRPGSPVLPCDGTAWCDVELALEPSNALYALFPGPYLVADQIGLGEAEICYAEVSWVDRRAEVPRFGNAAMASYFGRLSFVLKGRFSSLDEPIFEMRLTSPDEYEYLFGANNQEVLDDPCPRHLVNTQVRSEMPERRIELVPRRLTYMTADRTHPARVLDANWTAGQQWRDWFVTGRDVEILIRNDAEPILPAVEAQLNRLNAAWNQSLYRQMLAAGQNLAQGEVKPLTDAMRLLQTSKRVLAALAKVLAPRALEFDAGLRSTLFGDDGLFDRGTGLRLQQQGVPINELAGVAERRLARSALRWREASRDVSSRPMVQAEPLLVGNLLKLEAASRRFRSERAAPPGPIENQ
ncbi:MAG: hypothetical protein R3200_13760 [Xanthomonadales bacterium]|nr:hypothetical protein [Xanthomonadales bacterium]